MLKFIECPRDAMQGWPRIIPAKEKIAYLNALLRVGFDTLDFGSFVSAKAIPQMADTAEVLAGLDPSATKLLAIVANVRGAEDAVVHERIQYLGFPFSISETFQLRNTNKTIPEALEQVQTIQELCVKNSKQLVIYISMGFGNPYGDPYSPDVALEWAGRFADLHVPIISLADTVGVAKPEGISSLFSTLVPAYPQVEFGAHFHSTPQAWEEKIAAAWESGCRRFDSAIRGIGGCPMAQDDLVGNIATENLLRFCAERGIANGLNTASFSEAMVLADSVFHH